MLTRAAGDDHRGLLTDRARDEADEQLPGYIYPSWITRAFIFHRGLFIPSRNAYQVVSRRGGRIDTWYSIYVIDGRGALGANLGLDRLWMVELLPYIVV